MALLDEVSDEIEALNSIYGETTLTPSSPSQDEPHAYILILPPEDDAPEEAADPSTRPSLRVAFPPSYPATEPAQILATHSAGANARPGAAAHALSLFRECVSSTFVPGAVSLFDAIEEFRTRYAAEHLGTQPDASPPPSPSRGSSPSSSSPTTGSRRRNSEDEAAAGPAPPWTLSDPLTEMRSTFLARAAPTTSPAQASGFVSHLLATDKRARSATHNITAWRIRGRDARGGVTGASFQDCDDDGETAAGGRVLKLMQLMDVWDVVVVVTRWYGGMKLGPKRFAVINTVAREAVVRLVGDPAAGGKGDAGKKKKKGR